MSVGEKLRLLRGNQSKEEIASKIGVTVSSLTKYERDERTPRDEVKVRIANLYGESVQAIFY